MLSQSPIFQSKLPFQLDILIPRPQLHQALEHCDKSSEKLTQSRPFPMLLLLIHRPAFASCALYSPMRGLS